MYPDSWPFPTCAHFPSFRSERPAVNSFLEGAASRSVSAPTLCIVEAAILPLSRKMLVLPLWGGVWSRGDGKAKPRKRLVAWGAGALRP